MNKIKGKGSHVPCESSSCEEEVLLNDTMDSKGSRSKELTLTFA